MDLGPILMTVAAIMYAAGHANEHADEWLDALRGEDDGEQSPVDEAHQDYLEGRISEDELEERLEVLIDDRAMTIRDVADDADGIGDELSRDLAREFETVADLHAADVEELQAIDGIGDKRAETLVSELD